MTKARFGRNVSVERDQFRRPTFSRVAINPTSRNVIRLARDTLSTASSSDRCTQLEFAFAVEGTGRFIVRPTTTFSNCWIAS